MLEMRSYAYSTTKTMGRKSLEPGQLRAFVFLDTTACGGAGLHPGQAERFVGRCNARLAVRSVSDWTQPVALSSSRSCRSSPVPFWAISKTL